MKHFNHLFSALLLMVVLTTASCSGDFEEHPLSQAHAPTPTYLIQTLDSINNRDAKKETNGFATALYSTNYWEKELK